MSLNPERKENLEFYTVGHSNTPLQDFLELIDACKIEVIVDVRSNPYSRYASHFSEPLIKKSLCERGLKYVFLGQKLGGKPREAEFYDEEGHADYLKLAGSQRFKEGMAELCAQANTRRVAVMCGEEDPAFCHRHLLIGKVAHEMGISVIHIRKGGVLQDYESLARATAPEDFAVQLSLFGAQVKQEKDSASY